MARARRKPQPAVNPPAEQDETETTPRPWQVRRAERRARRPRHLQRDRRARFND